MSKKILLVCLIVLALGAGFFVYRNTLAPENHPTEKLERLREDEVYVYETEAESADECSSYEEYDETERVCYYECSTEEECSEISADIDAEIASWYDEDDTSRQDLQASDETVIDDNDTSLRAEYTVTPGEKIALKNGDADASDREVWNLVSKLSPDWLSDKYIDTFQIFENADDDTLAFVDDEDGDGKWRVGVNIATFSEENEKEKNLTIVHELGHIITLNSSQLDATKNASQCPLAFIEEGCPLTRSYLAGFVKIFWTQGDIAESGKENSKLYAQKPTNFITDYASTSFVEDIAESFAYFVFGEQNTADQTVASKKQQYFSQFPELVTTKAEILNGVKANIIRARKMGKQ